MMHVHSALVGRSCAAHPSGTRRLAEAFSADIFRKDSNEDQDKTREPAMLAGVWVRASGPRAGGLRLTVTGLDRCPVSTCFV